MTIEISNNGDVPQPVRRREVRVSPNPEAPGTRYRRRRTGVWLGEHPCIAEGASPGSPFGQFVGVSPGHMLIHQFKAGSRLSRRRLHEAPTLQGRKLPRRL